MLLERGGVYAHLYSKQFELQVYNNRLTPYIRGGRFSYLCHRYFYGTCSYISYTFAQDRWVFTPTALSFTQNPLRFTQNTFRFAQTSTIYTQTHYFQRICPLKKKRKHFKNTRKCIFATSALPLLLKSSL
jgi:predicted patatin/cPLA2 family phospholipase